MDTLDNFRERCEALAPQTHTMEAQTRTVQRRRRWWPLIWRVAAVMSIGHALAIGFPVQAKTFHCAAGDVSCLIAAIHDANANGQPHNTIRLEAGTYRLTTADNDSNGLPLVTSRLTMRGAGADATIIEPEASAGGFRLG